MADTYYVGTELISPVGTLERLAPDPNGEYNTTRGVIGPVGFQNAAGAPTTGQYVEHAAWYALFNSPGSGKRINLLSLSLVEQQIRRGATATTLELYRITATAGGVPVTGTVAMDSANYDLPAEITLRKNGGATTTGAPFRKMLDTQQLVPSVQPFRMFRANSSEHSNLDSSTLWDFSDTAGSQGLVLREGEGIALVPNTAGGRSNWPIALSVVFNVGTATHYARELLLFNSAETLFTLFNGSGSGKVVTLLSISVNEVTDYLATPLSSIELQTISGLHPNSLGRGVVEPQKLDTAAADLPSSIQSCLRAGVLQAHSSSYLVQAGCRRRGNENALRRMPLAPFGHWVGAAHLFGVGMAPGRGMKALLDFNHRARDSVFAHQLVLREGEGVALFQMQDTSGNAQGFWMDLYFTVEEAGAPLAYPTTAIINGGPVRAA